MGTLSSMRTRPLSEDEADLALAQIAAGNRRTRRAALSRLRRDTAVKNRISRLRRYRTAVKYKKITQVA